MSTPTKSRFESVVRNRLLENKLAGRKPDSIRGLARAMGKGDPVRAETFKRSLFKWMAPGEPHPSPESRAIVADALGVDRAALDDDDEESDPVSDLMKALHRVFIPRDEMAAQTTEPTASLEKATAGSDNHGG